MKVFLKIAFLFVCSFGFSQSKEECFCPKSDITQLQRADTVFTFSNNKKIGLCGYKEIINDENYYSEFVISECGSDKVIDSWDGTLNCHAKFANEKLIIETLLPLPLGLDYEYKDFVWSTEAFYFKGDKLERKFQVNKAIKKYNQNQVQEVLREFEKASGKLDDNKMVLCNKLFVASISNSEKAKKYFQEFETKFGELDGAFAEEYKELKEKLKLWRESN
jgi:hypothetical protein